MPEKIIELKNVAKKYCFSQVKRSLISTFLSLFSKKQQSSEVWALKDIDLSVEKGEILGIIGENASGKTTILRIISRITAPTRGTVIVKGKVAGLLDLGAGFHPELSGRENIYLDAALYGLSKKETDLRFKQILEFSGLENSIDSQVKTYSQGMLVRLGFSVAVHVSPDIFLIDDSLAVGDEEFQRKCINRVRQMHKQGTTIIIVSHDLDSLSRIAPRGILLKIGQILKDDSMHKAIIRYVQAVGEKKSIACIDQDNLSIIFNNGKIALLWDGKPLTSDFGGYLSVKVLDKWMLSWQANWQVIKTEKTNFIMSGKWPNSAITAEIEVNLRDQREFECTSRIDLPDNAQADKAVFGFMFNDKFNHYLRADEMSRIENRENLSDEQWQDLYRTDQRKALLVISSSDARIPAVWANFNIGKQRGFGLIQSKDKGFAASIMQMQVLLNQEKGADCQALIQLLEQNRLEEKISERQAKNSITKGSLKLKLEQKCFQFFSGAKQITQASGLVFGFKHKNHAYNIFDGQWKIKKAGESEFLVDSGFAAEGIAVQLRLILEDNQLLFKLSLQDKGLIQVEADIADDYDSYFELTQENDFLAATEFEEKIILKDAKCGFVGLSRNALSDEHIIFKTDQSGQIDLYNSRRELRTRRVRISNQNAVAVGGSLIIIRQSSEKQEFLAKERVFLNSTNLLGNDFLSIDCSQDRIRLFFGARELTALDGFASGMFLNKRWYESHALAKKIEKKDSFLQVKMQRKIPDIIEYWEFAIDKQSLIWNVYLEIPESAADLEYKAGIMLNPEFIQWINAYEQGRFAKDATESQIVELKETNSRLLGAGTADAGCCVLFKHDRLPGFSYFPLLQHSNRSRDMQFQTKLDLKRLSNNKKQVFRAELALTDPRFWQKEIARYCQEDFSVSADSWRLIAKQQKTELYHQNKLISADCGLAISISAFDEFDSFRGQWDIKQLDLNNLSIRITYANAQFAQNWYLREKQGRISWTVELEVFEQTAISGLIVNMFLPKGFKHWQTEQSQGRIDIDDQNQDFQAINLIDNRSGYIVFRQENLSDGQSLATAFVSLADMSLWLLEMYKPENKDIIALGIRRLFNDRPLILKPGKHEIFKADLAVFTEEIQLKDVLPKMGEKYLSAKNELVKGKLKLILEKAKISLVYGQEQLTRGLCLYTAIKANNQWADSSQAIWQIEQDAETISAKLSLNDLIKQTQKIKLISENEILWHISFESRLELIEQIAAGVMLSRQFTGWHTGAAEQKSGVFPDIAGSDIWQQIAVSRNTIGVWAKNNELPKISWESICNVECDNIIEDGDKNHNSRVLLTKTNNILDQNKTIEFKIRLKINAE